MSNHISSESLHLAHILLVGNARESSTGIAASLRAEGYQKLTCLAPDQDLLTRIMDAAVKEDGLDLIVVDLEATGWDTGRALCKMLSRTLAASLVVVNLGKDEQSRLALLKAAGIEDVFLTPVALDIFKFKCEKIISRRVLTQQQHTAEGASHRLFLNILQIMTKALETKDPYTKHHSEHVARYARQLAQSFGYDAEKIGLMQIAGILHDFGKIGVAEMVLNNPERLSAAEFETIKRHPVIASSIIEPIKELAAIIADVRHHHERYDGQGYPDGLAGEAIPLGARILCVADCYDAMVSLRPYQQIMTPEEARQELVRCSGRQFDPEVVKRFLEILDEEAARGKQLQQAY
ncbi:MAG: HD domain-containing protein [Planctomycetes bacterium]|nr:HD domain-containing protein [Planctomycetota bacterium]